MGAPVSYQRCDALKKLAKESDPREEELDEVDAPKQDEDLGETYTWVCVFPFIF